jgi:RES domain-containing protein
MRLYRIARTLHIRDLSGVGARLYGGRWNRRGTSILYASPTRALATVEYLVHVPISLAPAGLSIATIEVPDDAPADEIDPSVLPPEWRRHPPPPGLAAIGTEWAQSPAHALLLKVPSAVVEGEMNVLIDPLHPGMEGVELADSRPYTFDHRLLR